MEVVYSSRLFKKINMQTKNYLVILNIYHQLILQIIEARANSLTH